MARHQSENREQSQALEPGRREPITRPLTTWPIRSPLSMMRQFADEMNRMWEDVRMPSGMSRLSPWAESAEFVPEIDVFERDGKLVVRADLPGMTKDEVNVEITQDSVRIEGERKYEHEDSQEGIYRSERSYGSFYREIPLPEGVKTENATAKFKDGVLEVSMDASEIKKDRRRLQIQDESTQTQSEKSAA
jgi:HSP20 family protein